MNVKKERLKVYDMTCTSCEKRVEDAIMKLKGIISAKASFNGQYVDVEYDAEICSIVNIKDAVKEAGYKTEKSKVFGIIGIAAIGIIILLLGSSTQGFDMNERLNGATYMVLFVVGFLTSIHCVGMCGGIMLSQSISDDESGKFKAIKPSLLYNAGRVISYTILGGIVGALGSVLSLSLGFKAGLQVFAGIFMIVMGINMAGFRVFSKLNIRLPQFSCLKAKKGRTPFVVGILNGFMPCGPLQTMQLYALGTGSALKGGVSMFIFAVGTVPLMLAFGGVSGLLSKGYTKSILKFSGILVVVLGIVMGTRGLALSGINVSALASPLVNKGTSVKQGGVIVKPEIKDGVQIIRMTADGNGYTPNVLYVQKNMPVKWIIDGKQITYCNNEIVAPTFKIQKKLVKGENIIEFTPKDSHIKFSCWMGMIRGIIKVVDNIDSIDASDTSGVIPQQGGGSCCSGPVAPSRPSIYGDDFSKVPTDRLVQKAIVKDKIQTLTFKGNGYEFEPLIVVANRNIKAELVFDLNAFDDPEGEYIIIPANSNDIFTSFEGKKGIVSIEVDFIKSGGYGILKDNNILGVIEVVEDVKTADMERIRAKYLG